MAGGTRGSHGACRVATEVGKTLTQDLRRRIFDHAFLHVCLHPPLPSMVTDCMPCTMGSVEDSTAQ